MVISESAFMSQKITSVEFGSTCVSVGKEAFKDCISLQSINNNNFIQKIDSGAFENTNLNTVAFLRLSNIGNNAFKSCKSLTNIYIPICGNIGNNAFEDCENLKTINSIKNKFNIGDYTFKSCKNLKSMDFSNCKRIGRNAFEGCKQLSKVNLINCNVYDIGTEAFKDCENLKEITLPSHSNGRPTNINNYAFFNCNNLSRVFIKVKNPNLITLGNNVFYYSLSQSSYAIISSIRFYIFADAISSFKYNSYWKIYSNYMYSMADDDQIIYTTTDNKIIENENLNQTKTNNIITITFDNKIEKLETKIFQNQNRLQSIILPVYCKSIGEHEFENCTNLNEFIPSISLEQIDDYAFKNCESLNDFTIPDTVTSLGEGIFAGCKNIKSFEGNFVTYGGNAIVYDNTLICFLPEVDDNTDGRFYKISDIDSNIKILGSSCFHGCKEIIRIDIPSDVTKINNDVFYGCDNLREVHFDKINGDLEIDNNAFGSDIKNRLDFKIFVPEEDFKKFIEKWKDSNFISYVYPKPNNSIIYYGKKRTGSSDTEVEYGDNDNKYYKKYYKINNVGSTLLTKYFQKNELIEKVILGESITTIQRYSFRGCKKLEYIYIPNTIKEFGDECFCDCEKLKTIHIPNNIPIKQLEANSNKRLVQNDKFDNLYGNAIVGDKETVFGDNIFLGCKSLKEFRSYYKRFVSDDNMCYIVNDNLKFFAQGGLPSDSDYISYTIPINVISINKSTFKGVNINEININNTKTIEESAFEDCENLKTIHGFEKSIIESIGDKAFNNCKNLTKIILPSSLKFIGYACLATGTNNTEIYISEGLDSPPKFTINGNVTNRGTYPFGNLNSGKDETKYPKIYIPEKIYPIYEIDTYWSKYFNQNINIIFKVL